MDHVASMSPATSGCVIASWLQASDALTYMCSFVSIVPGKWMKHGLTGFLDQGRAKLRVFRKSVAWKRTHNLAHIFTRKTQVHIESIFLTALRGWRCEPGRRHGEAVIQALRAHCSLGIVWLGQLKDSDDYISSISIKSSLQNDIPRVI